MPEASLHSVNFRKIIMPVNSPAFFYFAPHIILSDSNLLQRYFIDLYRYKNSENIHKNSLLKLILP